MANSPDVEEPTKEYPVPDEAAGPAAPPPATPSPDDTTEDTPGRISGFARLLIFTAFVFALIVAACLGLRAVHVLPSFSNPFAGKTTDRSQPVLLQSMRDLSRYVAADGTFQVIVDLQEDKNNIPDFLINDRTLFVGSGTVEEYVDFGSLSTNAIKVDDTKKSVQVTLPPPQQSTAALDMDKSYVVAEQRGLLNRVGDAFKNDPNKQQKVYQLAQQRITDAAKSSGLDQRAEANTQKMLESLFTRLGFTSVSVTFTKP
jgi:Protein of unknown function (DUF4230)